MSLGNPVTGLLGADALARAPASLEQLDRDTLVPSAPYHLAWRSAAPRLALQVMAHQGTDYTWSWLNFAGVAPVGGCLAARFTAPSGVTGIAIELDGLMQAPSVGATGALGWKLLDGDGATVASGSWSVGASAAAVTSGTITVTGGGVYEARIIANTAGTQSSCLLQRIRVRPIVAADARWTSGFLALFAAGHLHHTAQVGYEPLQPAPQYPRQDGHAYLAFATNAPWVCVAAQDSIEFYVGSGRSAGAVVVSGQAPGGTRTVTPFSPVANGARSQSVTYSFVTLSPVPTATAPVRVEVRAAAAENGVYYAYGGPFLDQCAIAAVYLPASAVVSIEEPPKIEVVAAGDSKSTGAGSALEALRSQQATLDLFGYRTIQRGQGGDTATRVAATDAARKTESRAAAGAAHVFIGWGRNDLQGSTSVAQSTISGYLGALADELHARTAARVWFTGIGTEGATPEAAAFGSGGGTWNGFRATVAGLVTATGADGSSRSAWAGLCDFGGLATKAMMDGGFWSLDTVHGADPLQALQAEAMRAAVTASPAQIFSPLSLSPVLWCPFDAGALGAGTIGAVTSSGTTPPTITLSGTAVRALTILIRSATTGARGMWTLQWSVNGGVDWSAPVVSAASVVLGTTGLTASIGTGNASNDNLWIASTTIASIPDLSGNGRDLAQATDGNRANYSQVALGARPGAAFTASGSTFTQRYSVTCPSAAAYTIAVSARMIDTSKARAYFGGIAGATGAPLLYMSAAGQVTVFDFTNQISANTTPTSAHHFAVTCDGAGNGVLYIDGASAATGTLISTLTTVYAGGSAVDPAYNVYSCDGGVGDFFVGGFLGADAIRCLAAEARRAWGTG